MRIGNIDELGIPQALSKRFAGFVDTERVEGDLVARCEREFAEVHGLPAGWAAIGMSNGTDAIVKTLESVDVGFGDEVVVPGLTWQATAGAVLEANAVPVILDVHPGTLTLNPDVVEGYLERCQAKGRKLPKAILAVHLYCRAANVDRLVDIAKRYGILLLEDCAHAHGAAWSNRALGTFGAVGTFSTQRTKPLAGVKRPDDTRWECPTGSEGGFAITGVPLLDRRLRSLASCGRRVDASEIDERAAADELTAHWRGEVARLDLQFPVQSGNNRLPASVAERLLDQLARFGDEHAERAHGIEHATALLRGIEGIVLLDDQPQLTSPVAHMFAFRFVADAFAGMDNPLFRQVLSYQLGGYLVDTTYNPLGGGETGYQSPVYNPRTLKRYRLSDEHWRAIDPSQWSLPECHRAYRDTVVIENTALRDPEFGPALANALTWMQQNAGRLVAAAH